MSSNEPRAFIPPPLPTEGAGPHAGPVALEYATPASVVVRPRRFLIVRLACFAFAVVYPIFGLALNTKPGDETVPVDWQNGQPLAWISLTTMPAVGWPLWPFLVFAWACVGFAALMPGEARRRRVVRLGLWLGIAMGAEFAFIVVAGLADGDPSKMLGPLAMQLAGLPIGLIALGLCMAIEGLPRALRRSSPVATAIIVALLLVLVVATGLSPARSTLFGVLFAPLAGVFIAAPLSILGYAVIFTLTGLPAFNSAARAPGRIDRDRVVALVLGVGLIPLHGLAWVLVYLAAGPAYRALPTTQPTYCFVATAAASADRSRRTRHRQLRTLRAFESWMRSRLPHTHATVRRHYNAIGPRLARCVVSRRRANCAHRLLVLVEGPASLVLQHRG